ncbi:helix-turn-helix transcriptional regulator [Staphylococcus epidermidis]|uniref:helix-turn-helix transcriptional regulator n=1 Tax=Staphylococcus epidermidis TaxID=1282 RepID=UPI00138B16A9|nr:hypothetical protein [Staphylococcus epidermidis]
MNKIVGYRKMLGMTQSAMAIKFGISTQAYRTKEQGKVNFTNSEMRLFRDLLRNNLFPTITVDEIFFS